MLFISSALYFGSQPIGQLSSFHFLVPVRPYYHKRSPRWLPGPWCAAANSQIMLLRATPGGDDDDDEDANFYEDTTKGNNINGPYLDEETYLQAENNLLRPDGSLGLSSVSKIKNKTYQAVTEVLLSPAPSYSYDDDAHDRSNGSVLSDEEKLYRAVNGKVDVTNDNMIDPETLHREVFAEEEAYLQQSQTFRKALSSMTTNDESPMAKDRREEIERYNEKVLIDLLKEMDEMEAMAVSREEAIGSPVMDEKEAMMKRAETIRSTDEAKVRTAIWTPGSTSSYNGGSRMFDKKTQPWPKSNDAYKWRKDAAGKWRKANDDQIIDNKRSSIGGISTSSIFDMPKKRSDDYSAVSSTPIDVAPLKVQQIINDRLSSTIKNTPDYDRQRSPPSRRISPMLGGLAQRMQQRDLESRGQENVSEQQIHTNGQSIEKRKQSQTQSIVVDESSQNAKLAIDSINEHEVIATANNDHINSSWVKIEDSDSKRTLFWNTESGEMKNTM